MKMPRYSSLLICLSALLFSSCQTQKVDTMPYLGGLHQPSNIPSYLIDSVSFWDGEGVSGTPRVHISLSEQKARFYRGGHLVGVSKISTGREGHRTPPGTYKILQKNKDHRSNLYGDFVDGAGTPVVRDIARKDPRPPGASFLGAAMPYFMRLTNDGVGMHAGYIPGYPDSHGCIRLPEDMARNFFNNLSLKSKVVITR